MRPVYGQQGKGAWLTGQSKARLCAASSIRVMPETEIPPALRGDHYLEHICRYILANSLVIACCVSRAYRHWYSFFTKPGRKMRRQAVRGEMPSRRSGAACGSCALQGVGAPSGLTFSPLDSPVAQQALRYPSPLRYGKGHPKASLGGKPQ